MRTRQKAAALVSAAALLGGLTVVGGAASPALACSNAVDVGYTVKDGSYIRGSASWTKCTSDINRVTIDLHKHTVMWQSSEDFLDFNPAEFGSHERSVTRYCVGAGDAGWSVTVKAYNAAGQLVSEKTSNRLEVNC